MRPAIADVMHNTSGPTVRVNGHCEGELVTQLRLVVANSRPRWKCEVELDVCCRDFIKLNTREVCQLCKVAAIVRR
jgi:hypothetical protein